MAWLGEILHGFRFYKSIHFQSSPYFNLKHSTRQNIFNKGCQNFDGFATLIDFSKLTDLSSNVRNVFIMLKNYRNFILFMDKNVMGNICNTSYYFFSKEPVAQTSRSAFLVTDTHRTRFSCHGFLPETVKQRERLAASCRLFFTLYRPKSCGQPPLC